MSWRAFGLNIPVFRDVEMRRASVAPFRAQGLRQRVLKTPSSGLLVLKEPVLKSGDMVALALRTEGGSKARHVESGSFRCLSL